MAIIKVVLEPQAYQSEVDKYRIEGLQRLWMDILERYAHEAYYDPDLICEILEHQNYD